MSCKIHFELIIRTVLLHVVRLVIARAPCGGGQEGEPLHSDRLKHEQRGHEQRTLTDTAIAVQLVLFS